MPPLARLRFTPRLAGRGASPRAGDRSGGLLGPSLSPSKGRPARLQSLFSCHPWPASCLISRRTSGPALVVGGRTARPPAPAAGGAHAPRGPPRDRGRAGAAYRQHPATRRRDGRRPGSVRGGPGGAECGFMAARCLPEMTRTEQRRLGYVLLSPRGRETAINDSERWQKIFKINQVRLY